MVVEAALSLPHVFDIEGIVQMTGVFLSSRTEFVLGLEFRFLS